MQKLIARWLTPLYREGMAVIRATASESGWEPEEVPHLPSGLFGMVFAYFTNAAALQSPAGRDGEALSPRALAVQRRFQEKAIYRLLGPRPKRRQTRGRRRRA